MRRAAGVRPKFARHGGVQPAGFGFHGASGGVFLAGGDARRCQSQVGVFELSIDCASRQTVDLTAFF